MGDRLQLLRTGGAPPWLVGVWARTLLRVGRTEDRSTRVRYLQAGRWFGDVRVPAADRPDASCEGFGGWIRLTGDRCRWTRTIDLRPPAATPDEGRLRREGEVLVEDGVHQPYVEHWQRLDDGGGRWIVWGTEHPSDGLLVLIGDHFVRVRPGDVSYGRVRAGGVPWTIALSTRAELCGRALRGVLRWGRDPARWRVLEASGAVEDWAGALAL